MASGQPVVQKVLDYLILPLMIPQVPLYPITPKHYLYLRPHDPKLPHPDSSRSIFLSNVPIDSTEPQIRWLFQDQLAGGRIERVEFEALPPTKKHSASVASLKSKKRKRNVEIQSLEFDLPETWNRVSHASGSTAIVVFIDRPSMELSLKAARKAVNNSSQILWSDRAHGKLSKLGSQRYLAHHHLTYPSAEDLGDKVDTYMTSFAQAESTKARAHARQRQIPDDDGFVTVSRGGRTGPSKDKEAQARLEKQQKKAEEKRKGMEDFYRFQVREKRKGKAGELKRKFEEDLRKVEEMKKDNKSRFIPMRD